MRILMVLTTSFLLSTSGWADSLWNNTHLGKVSRSLYVDDKASQIGDIITILIVEGVSVDQKAYSSTTRSSDIKGEIKDWFNVHFGRNLAMSTNTAKVLPKWEIDTTNDFSGGGNYKGNYTVKGTITTRVVDILPNGNLVVEGKSEVRINNEINTVAVSGIIRPQDIGPNNTVLSTQVADARIHIIGKGPLNDKTKRGILGKLLDWVWPF